MSHPTRRHLLRASAGASLTAIVARPALAQPATTAALYAKAKREGSITYYATAVPTLTKRVIDLFTKTYPGIQVNALRLATGQMSQRYASEAEAGNVVADVVQLADPFLMADAEAKGWITTIDDLPDYAAFPADYKTRYNALVGIFPHTIVCNTSLVREADYPKDWRKMLDPRWKGQIILSDPRNNIEIADWVYTMFDAYGADYLQRMRGQQPKWVDSIVPGIQMMIAGEAALVAPALRQATAAFIALGAPVIDFSPDLDNGQESYIALSTKAPHPNAARLLTNLLLTRDGQEAYTKDFAASPLPNIPGALVLGKNYKRGRFKQAQAKLPEMSELLGLG